MELNLSIPEILERLVNLTEHPLFHEQTELPAWGLLIDAAKEALGWDEEK